MGYKASHIYYIRSCEKAGLLTQGLGSALNRPWELCPCCSLCLELSFLDSVGRHLLLTFQTAAKPSLAQKGLLGPPPK